MVDQFSAPTPALQPPTPAVLVSSGAKRLPPAARRAIFAATVGTAIEWYDYSLYGTVAAIVAGTLFFPTVSSSGALLAAFATFGVAFFARPFGGIIIGRIGDRRGRKPALMFSLTLMGTSTVLVAALPTYAAVGVWAPILLVLLRLAQGFGAGAELAGSLAIIAEYTSVKRRGFYTSLGQAASLFGVLLASLAFLAVSGLPTEALRSWGWRIPFLLAVLLFAVALYVRSKLEESPEYKATMVAVDARGPRNPLRKLLHGAMGRRVFLAFVLISTTNVITYTLTTFTTSYLKNTIGLTAHAALIIASIGTVVGILAGPTSGALGDRIGFRRVWVTALLLVIPGVFVFFLGLRTGTFWVCITAVGLAYLIGYAGTAGVYSAVFVNLFPTEVRFSGIALSKEMSGALVAGPTPFIGTALVLAGGGKPWWLAGYIALWCIASLIALWRVGSIAENPDVPNLLVQ